MAVAIVRTLCLAGPTGHLVEVQVDVAQGLVGTTLVGRPDTSISEARDRCRAAVVNCGLEWPTTRRVTVLLSPADLPKRGSHVDLAIAVGILAATGQVPLAGLADTAFFGELTLDGRLRAVPELLPLVLAARDLGLARVVVPESQAAEAGLVPGVDVVGLRSLPQVVARLQGAQLPEAPEVAPLGSGLGGRTGMTWRGQDRLEDLDLADVHGMTDARYAVEVAAAGGHHLHLTGPRGAGKTTLAERIPGLLPDLEPEQWVELCAVRALGGEPVLSGPGALRPPFRAPHPSASRTSLLGGGTGRVHPGEISKALHGVLFLDEFALFPRDLIESLRQPLESGEVTLTRGDEVASFPARSLVVLASNPCPCGDFHHDARLDGCTCSETARRRYRDRLSGPVIDRIDITRHLTPVREHELDDFWDPPESTAIVRARVEEARTRQVNRYAGTAWRLNSDVPGPVLLRRWPLPDQGRVLVENAVARGRLTRRGATRVHRLAWTVADLAGIDAPDEAAVRTALLLRTGEPLALADLPPREPGGPR